jgi:HD-like signal output (HDOD) protein
VVAMCMHELAHPEPDLRIVGQLMGADPLLTLRLLALANAAGTPMAGRVHSIPEALAILGTPQLQGLAHIASHNLGTPSLPGLSMQQFWRFSVDVAKLSRALAGTIRNNPSTAYAVGLCHAVGELFMHIAMPEEMEALNQIQPPFDLRRARLEHKRLGYSYADVAAGLARQWGLPERLVDALQYQIAPFDNESYEPLAGVLHLAAWRARAKVAELDQNALAVSFPGEIGEPLGLDIDIVLQQDPLDWRDQSAPFLPRV